MIIEIINIIIDYIPCYDMNKITNNIFLNSNVPIEWLEYIIQKNNLTQSDWIKLCSNRHPNIYKIIEKYPSKVIWNNLMNNESTSLIPILKKHINNTSNKIEWYSLSSNKNIMKIIDDESSCIDMLHWTELSINPGAIPIINKHLDKIYLKWLSLNTSAIHIIENNLDKIDWVLLSSNVNAIPILENNLDKLNWIVLSGNKSAIKLLEKNVDKIDWTVLSGNPNAIHLLENNMDRIDWRTLSSNPSAISLLETNKEKVDWHQFSLNPNICKSRLILKEDDQLKLRKTLIDFFINY